MAKENFSVSLEGLESFKPQESTGKAPAAVFAKDGNYMLRVLTAEAKRDGHGGLYGAFSFICLEDDQKNDVIYTNVWVDGEYQSGNRKGHKRVEDLLSMGIRLGKQDLINEMLANKSFDLQRFCKEIVGAEGPAAVRTQEDNDGEVRTKPAYFITREAYDNSKSTGAGWRTAPRIKTTSVKKSVNGAAAGAVVATDAIDASV